SIATHGAPFHPPKNTHLTSPMRPPHATQMRTATAPLGHSVTPHMAIGPPLRRYPPTPALNPRVEPTDRSIPPVSTTMSMPSDSSAKIATWEDMINTLFTVR